jgi:hypothetical protein
MYPVCTPRTLASLEHEHEHGLAHANLLEI